MGLLSCELWSKFVFIFDFLLEFDWKVLVDKFGFIYEYIKWIDSRKNYFFIEIFFNYLEMIDVL